MMKFSLKKFLCLLVESLLISLSVYIATSIKYYIRIDTLLENETLLYKTLLIITICQVSLYYNDFYDFKVSNKWQEWLGRLVKSLGVSALMLAIIYFFFPNLIIGRGIFVISIIFIIFFISLWRWLFGWVSEFKQLKENILIVGSGNIARTIAEEIFNHAYTGINIAGFIDNNKSIQGKSVVNPKIIGTYDEIINIVKEKNINKIIIAVNDRRGLLPIKSLMDCRFKGITIEEATSFYENITGKIMVENLKPSWLIFSDGFRKLMFSSKIKRTSGIIFSFIGIILFSPLMLLTAILVKLDSKGPVFYKQERVGENRKNFNLIKFRSMKVDAESISGPVWAKDQDDRITKVGNFIRKTRLDELPQLFNVLKGDMNFVGPRPERLFFIEKLEKEIPYYELRLSVKPGITGWAQIMYQYGNTVEDTLEKLQYDLYYIKNGTLLLDLSIVLETIKVVVLRKGAK